MRRTHAIAVVTGVAVVALFSSIGVAALTTGKGEGQSGRGAATPTRPVSSVAKPGVSAYHGSRVIILVEENTAYSQIIGSPSAPFLNALARGGTLLTSYYGVTHPSLPNYLAMIGGSTFGIRSDCTACRVNATNLVDQLQAAGISWRAYLQGLPAACSSVPYAGAYAKKHNPFMYFEDISDNSARCHNVVPFQQFAKDLAANRLPRFVFISPDIKHDMHSGPVSVADQWARTLYTQVRGSYAWREPTRFIVTFDEGTTNAGCCNGLASGGQVATIIAGPGVSAGARDARPSSHYSLLASVEALFGLPRLRNAGAPGTQTIPSIG